MEWLPLVPLVCHPSRQELAGLAESDGKEGVLRSLPSFLEVENRPNWLL